MKRILALTALWLAAAVLAHGQVSNPSVRYVAGAPSGACAAAPPIQIVISTGVMYTCNNGTWGAIGGSGSGTVSAGTAGQETYYTGTTTVSGGKTVYLVPSGGDDSTQINAACTDGASIELAATPTTHFSVTSGITINHLCSMKGAGIGQTIIDNAGTTDTAMTVSPQTLFTACCDTTGATIGGFSINQKAGVTPTTGTGIYLGQTGSYWVSGIHLHDIQMTGLWSCADIEAQQTTNYIDHLYCNNVVNTAANSAVLYNSPAPSGGDYFDTWTIAGSTHAAGITITASDTNSWLNISLSGGQWYFNSTGTGIGGIRILNTAVENSVGSQCAFYFATAIEPITIIGGTFSAGPTAIACDATHAAGGSPYMTFTGVRDTTADNAYSGTGYPIVSSSMRSRLGSQLDDRTPNPLQVFANNSATTLPFSINAVGANDYSAGFSALYAGGNWYPYGTSAAILEDNAGRFNFYTDTGLTAGVAYTPTARLSVGVASAPTGACSPNGWFVLSEDLKITYCNTTWHNFATSIPAQYETWAAQDGLVSTAALGTTPTPAVVFGVNGTGATQTITAITCFVDAGTGTTFTLVDNASNNLLGASGTCAVGGASIAVSGTHFTLSAGGYMNYVITPNSTAKTVTLAVSGTY
jgi:hypothetical protein